MEIHQKIISYIQSNGPSLPIDISKEILLSSLITSAHLSELASAKKIKISNIKVGGSPLYYLPGQENRLSDFSKYLVEKEKQAFDLLMDKKLLKDSALEPVQRVAIRRIKDFAVPLMVNNNNESQVFWKWHLMDNSEAEKAIKEHFVPQKSDVQEKISTPPADKKPPIQKDKKPQSINESFVTKVLDYFNRNKIQVLDKTITRKSSEAEFTVELPSGVGPLVYYVRAKAKKRLNEGDLSSTFIRGQARKLPTLLVTTGDLTKKGKEMLLKEFKGMSVRKI